MQEIVTLMGDYQSIVLSGLQGTNQEDIIFGFLRLSGEDSKAIYFRNPELTEVQ